MSNTADNERVHHKPVCFHLLSDSVTHEGKHNGHPVRGPSPLNSIHFSSAHQKRLRMSSDRLHCSPLSLHTKCVWVGVCNYIRLKRVESFPHVLIS